MLIQAPVTVLPFDKSPKLSQTQVEYFLRFKLSSATGNVRSGWFIWEKLRQFFGLSNDIPQLTVLQWKPLYLPVWLCDYVSIVHARLDGVDHDLDVSTFDMILPGTQVPPLNSAAIKLAHGEALAEALEDYDPEEHLKLPKEMRMNLPDNTSPNVVPVAFTLFPSSISKALSRAFTAIRDEDVRIPGDANTVLYAAYPLYVPYYLIDYMDENPLAGPDGRKVTTVVQGRESGLGKGMSVQDALKSYSYPQWWREEDQVWIPDLGYQQSFDVQGYRRNRPSAVQDSSSEESDFSSMSPIKSAQAAARSGAYQGSGVGEEAAQESVKSLRKKAEHAGQLMIEAMRGVLQPLRTNTAPSQAPAEFSEIARTMDQFDGFMEYQPHAQLNRQYVEKVNAMRIAQESLKHAQAMPIIREGETAKAVVIAPSDSALIKKKISVKVMSRDELQQYKARITEDAKSKLKDAIDEAEKAKPGWLK